MEEVKYIKTNDIEIVKRFLEVAPTKYLVGIMKQAFPKYELDKNFKMCRACRYAKWSFSKDENYFIEIPGPMIYDELKNRPNIKNHKKMILLNLKCNCCGNNYDLIGWKDGHHVRYSVSPDRYIWGNNFVSRKLSQTIDKAEYADFKCPNCGENFIIKL